MKVELDNIVSVSEANARGMSKLVTEAQFGREWVICRNNKPAAVMMSVDRARHLQQLEAQELRIGTVVTSITRLIMQSDQAVDLDQAFLQCDLTPEDVIEPMDS